MAYIKMDGHARSNGFGLMIRQGASVWLRLLRVHQWTKNLLIFVPLLASHRLGDLQAWVGCFRAVVGFSFLASAVYILNDWFDVEADKLHPSKSSRPLASGDTAVQVALLAAFVCLGLSVWAFTFLPSTTFLIVVFYLLANAVYTLWAKQVVFLDVVLLASFYGARILVGGTASGIEVSNWLLAFSHFFFLGLALAKRCTEVRKTLVPGRGYTASDYPLMVTLGVCSSLLSVLVLVVYLNSPKVLELYRLAGPLWLVVPILTYWVSRLWVLTTRGLLDDDPVLFAVRDPVTWGVGVVLCGLLFLSAR